MAEGGFKATWYCEITVAVVYTNVFQIHIVQANIKSCYCQADLLKTRQLKNLVWICRNGLCSSMEFHGEFVRIAYYRAQHRNLQSTFYRAPIQSGSLNKWFALKPWRFGRERECKRALVNPISRMTVYGLRRVVEVAFETAWIFFQTTSDMWQPKALHHVLLMALTKERYPPPGLASLGVS